MMRKLVSLVLCLVMALALLNAASATETSLKAPDDYIPSIFPLKDEITLTVFVMDIDGGKDYFNNYVTQWIKEKTNINLEVVYDVSGDDGKTKLNLLLYSGEKLPDIFLATKWTKAETELYGSEGIVMPLNDLLKDCRNWNLLNEWCPARRGDLTMSDGNIYTYGNTNDCFHCTHQARMWIYQPWVDSLNGGVLPTTTDELYDFLVKVKTMDPNGNGIADEVPFSGYLGGWATDPVTFISNSFVQNNNIMSSTNPTVAAGFSIQNGKVTFSLISDGYRKALSYMNKLYKEGLLDLQTFTQTGDQSNATHANEDHLVALMPCGVMPQNDNFWTQSAGLWEDWTLLPPLQGPDGVQLAYTQLNSYFGSCVGLVSSDCEYPEVAVQLFDLLSGFEGTLVQGLGIEGINWGRTTEGTSLTGGTPSWEKLVPDKRTADGKIDWEAYGYNWTDDYINNCWASDAAIQGNTNDMRCAEAVPDPAYNVEAVLYRAALEYDKYAFDVNSIMPDVPYTSDQSKKIADYTVSVGAYANQATVRFITGDLNVDTDWEAYLQEMNKMDVQGYINVLQEAYDAYLAALSK